MSMHHKICPHKLKIYIIMDTKNNIGARVVGTQSSMFWLSKWGSCNNPWIFFHNKYRNSNPNSNTIIRITINWKLRNNKSNKKSNKAATCISDRTLLSYIITLMSNICQARTWVYLNHPSVTGSLWLTILHIIQSNSPGLLSPTMWISVTKKVASDTLD